MSTILKTKSAWTAEDLEHLPDTEHYELIEGELAPMTPGGEGHGSASSNLHIIVGGHILARNLGRTYTAETGFHLASKPDTVLAPDFAFVTVDRCSVVESEKFSTIVPDLVLETRSPGDTLPEIKRKIARWLSFGVQVVWDLDPRRAVLNAHYAGGRTETFGLGDTLTCDPFLPDLSVPIRSIFPDR